MTGQGPVQVPQASWRDFEEEVLPPPILSQALDAFVERGFEGTAVRDLARRVGMTVPGLYYYYENKEALLWALLDQPMRKLLDWCDEAIEEAAGDVALQFEYLIACMVRFMAVNHKLAEMNAERRSLTPEHHIEWAARRRHVEELLISIINAGVDEGRFQSGDPGLEARAILGMIQSVSMWWSREGGPWSIDDVVTGYVDLAIRSLRAT